MPEMKGAVASRRIAHVWREDFAARGAVFPALEARQSVKHNNEQAKSEIEFVKHFLQSSLPLLYALYMLSLQRLTSNTLFLTSA